MATTAARTENEQILRSIILDVNNGASQAATSIADLSARINQLNAITPSILEDVYSRLAQLEGENAQLKGTIAQTPSTPDRTQINSILAELKLLSARLENSFNPTPGTDALIVAVQNSPDIPTPPAIANVEELGTSTPTPAPLLEEALRIII